MFAYTLATLAMVNLATACNPDPGESASLGNTSTSDTNTTAGGETTPTTSDTDVPLGLCANPQFQPGDGPGTMLQCTGEVTASFTYTACAPFCNQPGSPPIDPIPFPAMDEVGACCTENATEEQVLDACFSDCAHAACLGAIDKFQQLIDDINNSVPGNPAEDCPTQNCRDNAVESLTFFRNYIQLDDFAGCVQSVKNNVVFGMGDPPSCSGVGCLQDGVLDLDCDIAGVNTVVLEPVCDDALNQPPTGTREAGPIVGGEIAISGLGENDVVAMTGTYVQFARPTCGAPPCPLVLEDVNIAAGNFKVGPFKVSNFKAALATSAQGSIIGDSAVFPAGAISLHVTADIKAGKGPKTAFSGYASSEADAYVDTTDGVFSLSNAVFSMGPLQFEASVDPSPCEPM